MSPAPRGPGQPMLPIKDNTPRTRAPLATCALVALAALAYALTPSPRVGTAGFVLGALAVALLGPGVEATIGRPRFLSLCVAGAAVTFGARVLAGPAGWPPAALTALLGAGLAVLGAYPPLRPHGRVLTLVLVPFYVTIVEVPAALLLAAWTVAQGSLAVAGLR